jgi:hypothetical protein
MIWPPISYISNHLNTKTVVQVKMWFSSYYDKENINYNKYICHILLKYNQSIFNNVLYA